MKARDIIFLTLVGFLVAWSALSAFALLQAMAGFTETYSEIVTKNPSLATNAEPGDGEGTHSPVQHISTECRPRWVNFSSQLN